MTNPKELRDLQAACRKALELPVENEPLPELDVPHAWFGRGPQSARPKGSLYSGCYRRRCVWGFPEHVEALTKFTLIVLRIVELKEGERAFRWGVISAPR